MPERTEAIREGDIPGVQLRRRQPLPLPPQEAWGWLSDGARLERWLAGEATVEAGPQGSLRLTGWGRGTDEGGGGWRERGRTLVWTPPGLWVLAFERLDAGWTAATRLTLALHPLAGGVGGIGAAGGTELDVLQHGFQRLPLSLCLTAWEDYRRRWRTALARLAEAVAP